jgi:hypothetical protein
MKALKSYTALPVKLMVAFIILIISGAAHAQSSDSLKWSFTPYIWASHTTLDLSLRGSPIGGTDISFSDLMDVTDAAFQAHVEAGKNNWSMFVDLAYISTSDSFGEGFIGTDSKSKQTFIDAVAAYWPAGVGSSLNFYGGVRYTDFNNKYSFSVGDTPVGTRQDSSDYFDALLGVRYRFDLSERWSLLTRGDVSFGDSEGTWLVQGLFAYTVGKRQQNRILFGYQYKQAEYKDGELNTEYSYYGPMAGFNFRF